MVLKRDSDYNYQRRSISCTALRPKFGKFSWRKISVRKVKPRSTIPV